MTKKDSISYTENLFQNPPNYLVNAGIIGIPIKYKWNTDLGLKFFAARDMNIRLSEVIDASGSKAQMALGAAITEWIVWRLKGHTDIVDALLRIEAAWASAIDPDYIEDLSCEMTRDDDKDPIGGPLELALCLLGEIDAIYANGENYLAGRIVNLSMLAQHLMPDKKVYNDWLSGALSRMAEEFPRKPLKGKYDSNKKPVPREFFDPAIQYTEKSAKATMKTFLHSLNPEHNPYIRSGEKMLADGFKGEPYKL